MVASRMLRTEVGHTHARIVASHTHADTPSCIYLEVTPLHAHVSGVTAGWDSSLDLTLLPGVFGLAARELCVTNSGKLLLVKDDRCVTS